MLGLWHGSATCCLLNSLVPNIVLLAFAPVLTFINILNQFVPVENLGIFLQKKKKKKKKKNLKSIIKFFGMVLWLAFLASTLIDSYRCLMLHWYAIRLCSNP